MKFTYILPSTFLAGISLTVFKLPPANAFNLVYQFQSPSSFQQQLSYTTSRGNQGLVFRDPLQKRPIPDPRLLRKFRDQFPSWTFVASSTPVYGNFLVHEYRVCIPNGNCPASLVYPSLVGAVLNFDYKPKLFFDPELGSYVNEFPDPSTGQVQWIQWVNNNHKITGFPNGHNVQEAVIDTRSNTPFYYGERLGPNPSNPNSYFMNNKIDPYYFDDNSGRGDNNHSHYWLADLFLAYQIPDPSGSFYKVQVFGGVKWGWHNIVNRISMLPNNSCSTNAYIGSGCQPYPAPPAIPVNVCSDVTPGPPSCEVYGYAASSSLIAESLFNFDEHVAQLSGTNNFNKSVAQLPNSNPSPQVTESSTSVPEPGSVLGLVAVGTWAGFSWRKKKGQLPLEES